MAKDGLSYSTFMDVASVEAMFTKSAGLLPGYVNRWLLESGMLAKEVMSKNAPEGVAGVNGQGLQNHIGITHDLVAMTVEIKPDKTIPYADAVETGSKPHMPPHGPDSALAQWAEMKGYEVHALAWHIAHYGTKPHPYIEPTYQEIKPLVSKMFTEGVSSYIERMQYVGL